MDPITTLWILIDIAPLVHASHICAGGIYNLLRKLKGKPQKKLQKFYRDATEECFGEEVSALLLVGEIDLHDISEKNIYYLEEKLKTHILDTFGAEKLECFKREIQNKILTSDDIELISIYNLVTSLKILDIMEKTENLGEKIDELFDYIVFSDNVLKSLEDAKGRLEELCKLVNRGDEAKYLASNLFFLYDYIQKTEPIEYLLNLIDKYFTEYFNECLRSTGYIKMYFENFAGKNQNFRKRVLYLSLKDADIVISKETLNKIEIKEPGDHIRKDIYRDIVGGFKFSMLKILTVNFVGWMGDQKHVLQSLIEDVEKQQILVMNPFFDEAEYCGKFFLEEYDSPFKPRDNCRFLHYGGDYSIDLFRRICAVYERIIEFTNKCSKKDKVEIKMYKGLKPPMRFTLAPDKFLIIYPTPSRMAGDLYTFPVLIRNLGDESRLLSEIEIYFDEIWSSKQVETLPLNLAKINNKFGNSIRNYANFLQTKFKDEKKLKKAISKIRECCINKNNICTGQSVLLYNYLVESLGFNEFIVE